MAVGSALSRHSPLVPHQFQISPLTDRTGYRVAGDIDLATAPQLRAAVDEAPEDGAAGGLYLDLSGVAFIDSTGCAVLLGLAKARAGKGPLVILDPSLAVARVISLMELERHPHVRVEHAQAAG